MRWQGRFNETNLEAKRQFSVRLRDVLMNAQFPDEWFSTLQSAVFGSSTSLPLLFGGGGGLVCGLVGKADLSDHLDSKRFKESVDLPLNCHPSPSLIPYISSFSSENC